jgi:hypothetical protein
MLSFDHVVLNVTANAVLGPEQRSQIDLWMLMKEIRGVVKVVVDGCLITNKPNPGAPQQVDFVIQQAFNAQFDWFLLHLLT